MNADAQNVLRGLGVSPGVAVGPLLIFRGADDEVPRHTLPVAEREAELRRFRRALQRAEQEFQQQRESFTAQTDLDGNEMAIFDAHLQLYQDAFLRESIEKRVQDAGLNAEAAIADEVAHVAALLSQTDSLFQERVADVRDVGRRIIRILQHQKQESLEAGDQPVVLYARELLPSDTLAIDRSRLLAIVTEVGGEASHVAILARAFGIPSVSGIQHLESRVNPGTNLAVDGSQGRVLVDPTPAQRSALTRARESYLKQRQELVAASAGGDHERAAGVQVLLNIENFDALDDAVLATTEGVGLYRTEFLFMESQTFPSEEEQFEFYVTVLSRMDGREVTFRTIDVGADKPLSYLSVPREPNPVLGWRGIRLTFEWPDLLIPQLRALLRASVVGKLKVMLPMITTAEEYLQVRALFERLATDLRREGVPLPEHVPLGVMIEVPAAALAATDLARVADFLSVGTNDLGQYLFAVDRNNIRVAGLYQPLHPVMLRLLADVVRTGREEGVSVTVCGEMAGQPLPALALYGLGLERFSMSPAHLPDTRWVFELFSREEAAGLCAELLALRSESEVVQALRKAVERRSGDRRLALGKR